MSRPSSFSSSSSSKTHKQKCTTALPESKKIQTGKKKRQQQQQRNPFQDLSNGGTSTKDCSFDTNNNNSSSNASSMSSIEAPKGCLRFFLSHSSTKTASNNSNNNHRKPTKFKSSASKTPKSAPNARPRKENSFLSQKVEKFKRNPSQGLYQWHSGKKPSLRYASKFDLSSGLDSNDSSFSKLKCVSGELNELAVVDRICESEAANLTPLSRVTSGSCLNFAVDGNGDGNDDDKLNIDSNNKATNSDTKTPPVQVSVSPEIQCGSSVMVSTTKMVTPACYGAGHVVSGIADKRKCRPRGILTVGEAKALDCFDDSDDYAEHDSVVRSIVNHSGVSMLPLPADASMHWLLSPCNEEDEDQKENLESGLGHFQMLEEGAVPNSPASPSSWNSGFSPDLCNDSSGKSLTNRVTSILSPNELPEFQGFIEPPFYDNLIFTSLEEERGNCCDMDAEKSPFSIDSLSNRNVIQTPQSDSSSEKRVDVSWLCAESGQKIHDFDSELDAVTVHLQMTSLSPKSHASIWDPTSSSFQYHSLTTPSNSVDLSRFQKILVDRASWFSNSTLETVSQSQMRISWREGLVSRMFEMDEFDCCRCLSDEEDNVKACNIDSLNSHQFPELNVDMAGNHFSTNELESAEFVGRDCATNQKVNGELVQDPKLTSSYAESISTDGGGLVRSEDSDWTICYKNHLFQV